MKKLILAFALALPLFGAAQISNAFRAGNYLESSKYLGNIVRLNWMGEESQSSSLEVTNKLKELFEICEVENFRVIHNGESDSGLQYAMGELYCEEGEYAITYYYTTKNATEIIEELIIEKK
jgi:hypothetical protein